MRPRLDLKLSQKLVMTPQLQQAIKMLQLTRLELAQSISQQLLENPLLEDLQSDPAEESSVDFDEERPGSSDQDTSADEPSADTDGQGLDALGLEWAQGGDDDQTEWREAERPSRDDEDRPSFEQTLTKQVTLADHLLWQLSVSGLEPADKEIGTHLIGNIDDDGYLRVTVDEVAAAINVPPGQVEEVLRQIQAFDPTGVGARTLQECLVLQVRQLGLADSLVAILIEQELGSLEHKDYGGIARRHDCSENEVLQAARVIERLEPKPGRPFAATGNQYIVPDVYIVRVEGESAYRVVLNDDGLPRLRVNGYYRRLLRTQGEIAKSTKSYIEERFRSALWFIRSIEQRNRTICRVTESIVKFQGEFFEKGLPALKPLVLRQVAEDVSLHESTISRVTTNKYAHTPQGILELKYFFNGGIASTVDGESATSRVLVREMIRKMVDEEDPGRPLRDDEITERLRAHHVDIARRTIAKYRSMLNIPSAGKRKRARS